MRGLRELIVCCALVTIHPHGFPRASGNIAQAARPTFRGRIDLVNLSAVVTDRKGGLATDLGPDDFEVYEDGRRQEISYYASGGDGGEGPDLHLGLLLDVSGSMDEDIRFSKDASVKFLNKLTDAVDVTVVDFDSEVRAARYDANEHARLVERIRQKKAAGNTALYDAIGLYLDGASEQVGRKIMLLYTDGGDTHSSMQLRDLMNLLRVSDAVVYVIGELQHQPASAKIGQRLILEQIADATGGQAFFPTSVKELDTAYDSVIGQIRAQYTLGYVSTNQRADGTWRKVEIRVRKDLRVRARKGYFAPLAR